MRLTKRQFLKMGMGGTAAWVLAPLLKPASLMGSPLMVPPSYLGNAFVHSYWMKLSYNDRLESRRTRRYVGAALRNIGAIKGDGLGFDFTLCFDKALEAAFVRWASTRQKPRTLFGLVQMLYDDFVFPKLGPAGGVPMFGTLLGMLRGLDGSSQGAQAHQSYEAYRRYSLLYKDAGRLAQDPKQIDELRRLRAAALAQWKENFHRQVMNLAYRQTGLNPSFPVDLSMMEGFHPYVNPAHEGQAKLSIEPAGKEVIVSWKGAGKLQEAPTVDGPWTNARKSPPATFEVSRGAKFFRTADE